VTFFWPLGFGVASRFLENLYIPEVMQLLNDIMRTKSNGGNKAAEDLSDALKSERNTVEVLAGFTAIRSSVV
jgi:hypothetical protein